MTSVATMRSMARTLDGRSALVEPKAVDANYPSVGDARDRAGAAARANSSPTGTARSGAVADGALFVAARPQGRRQGAARRRARSSCARSSSPSPTSWRPASISARASCSCAGRRCAPPACCSPAAWCAGPIASSLPARRADDAALARFSRGPAEGACPRPASRRARASTPPRSSSATSSASRSS